MRCSNCQHAIDNPAALFCPQCGHSLAREAGCRFCGNTLQADANFCDRCGMPTNAVPTAPLYLASVAADQFSASTAIAGGEEEHSDAAIKTVVEEEVRRRVAEAQAEHEKQEAAKRLAEKANRYGVRENDWARIEGGHFQMGSPADEPDRFSNERLHEVDVGSFEILKTPVTFAMFDLFCDEVKKDRPDDEGWGRGGHPVINVTYWRAAEYCNWLAKRTHRNVRLPTEAEWEYACRAGTTTPFWTGNTLTTDQANFDGNYSYGESPRGIRRGKTTPVDTFAPNPWGLYDMHGNVWEWCGSVFDEIYSGNELKNAAYDYDNLRERVVRGGSWHNVPGGLRSACRNKLLPNFHYLRVGFRIARDIE